MITSATGAGAGGASGLLTPAGGKLGKEEFLHLLVTQLRYQDPLNPMQAEDFAVQLAQFSSVEQLINLNDQLAAQSGYSEALIHGFNTSAALGVLGHTVTAVTDRVVVGEDGAEPITVDVGESGGAATLKLYDAAGKEVGSRALGNLPGGRHTVAFGDAAASLEPGVYRMVVEVADTEGNPVATQTYATVRIDGIRYDGTGPVLLAGPLEIPLSSVRQVSNP